MPKAKPEKNKGGRPTKYSPAVLKKTYEYIDNCNDRFFKFMRTDGATSQSFERLVDAGLPTVEGLALSLKVHRDTIQEWKRKHPSFSVALEELDQKQRQMLIKGGLSGYYNPLITKLVLSANHGMKDRVDATTDDKPLPAPVTVNNFKNLSDEELIALARGGKEGASA